MNDLFEKQAKPAKLIGKMGELACWIADRGIATTSDVSYWGTTNYYVSAIRAACLLAERGYLRRMTDEEVKRQFGKELGQGVWVPTDLLRRIQ